jgi:hypothetical protein
MYNLIYEILIHKLGATPIKCKELSNECAEATETALSSRPIIATLHTWQVIINSSAQQ